MITSCCFWIFVNMCVFLSYQSSIKYLRLEAKKPITSCFCSHLKHQAVTQIPRSLTSFHSYEPQTKISSEGSAFRCSCKILHMWWTSNVTAHNKSQGPSKILVSRDAVTHWIPSKTNFQQWKPFFLCLPLLKERNRVWYKNHWQRCKGDNTRRVRPTAFVSKSNSCSYDEHQASRVKSYTIL